jgi:hypothetical protein
MIQNLRDLHEKPLELAERLKASPLDFKEADLSPRCYQRGIIVVNYHPLRQDARQIRLIKLLPAIQQPAEIRCRLKRPRLA